MNSLICRVSGELATERKLNDLIAKVPALEKRVYADRAERIKRGSKLIGQEKYTMIVGFKNSDKVLLFSREELIRDINASSANGYVANCESNVRMLFELMYDGGINAKQLVQLLMGIANGKDIIPKAIEMKGIRCK